ncbi:MAG: hypothetical protein COA83_01280 [Methylophaga sp.]|nr:MAG: hypothetical protein COA83_01280 [Methylophaga sp.]
MDAGRLGIYNCHVFLSINGDLDVPFLYPEDRDSRKLIIKPKQGKSPYLYVKTKYATNLIF